MRRHSIGMCLIAIMLAAAGDIVAEQGEAGKELTLSEALEMTFKLNPQLLIAKKQVAAGYGSFRSAAGQFSYNAGVFITNSRTRKFHPELSTNHSNSSAYGVSIYKSFTSGTSLDFTLSTNRTSDDFSTAATNNSSVYLSMTMPFLRGTGASASENLRITEESIERNELNYLHAISQSVLNTSIAYWSYVISFKSLGVLRNTEQNAEKLVKETRTLVLAEERPEADLQQPLANLAFKKAQRARAEQDMVERRHSLGLAIGLKVDQMASLPPPVTDFPAAQDGTVLHDMRLLDNLIKIALKTRQDYLGLINDEGVSRIRVAASNNRAKPQMNLSFNVGYTGLNSGNQLDNYFTPLGQNMRGPNIMTRLEFGLPSPGAEGDKARSQAGLEQAVIRKGDYERLIRSNVTVAVEALKRSVEELKSSREAVELYESSLYNINQKLQHGMATLIDQIFIEDQLTTVMLNEIQSKARYAIALIQLRYETGTLIDVENHRYVLGLSELFSIPAME